MAGFYQLFLSQLAEGLVICNFLLVYQLEKEVNLNPLFAIYLIRLNLIII